MNLIGILRKLGDRIGIIEMSSAETQTSAPAKIQTRTITLSELMMTVQISEVHELAERPADLSVPFEDIFKAAGHNEEKAGWTVERLQEFVFVRCTNRAKMYGAPIAQRDVEGGNVEISHRSAPLVVK